MYEYVTKWESCTAQLASIDAPPDEKLLETVFTKYFGYRSELLYRITLSASLKKNDMTLQALTPRLLQKYNSQNATKNASSRYNESVYVASSGNQYTEKR